MDGRLWAYVPGAIITPHNKPLLRGEWLGHHWAKLSWPNVARSAHAKGFGHVELLYLDSIAQAFWLEAVKWQRSVYRLADKSSAFEKSTPAMAQLERKIAQSVSLVVYTAYGLRSYVESLGPRSMLHLPNGVNFHHFAQGDRSVPADLAHVPRPIAIYVGAMDVWFDYDLMNFATRNLPRVSFVLIGPEDLARRRLQPRSNLYVLGRRSYDSLPSYMHNSDVGLIPFDVAGHADLVNHIHPLKLYEYMACGLPVVAVEWEELRHLASPAVLTNDASNFVDAIQTAVSGRPDREAHVQFASSADWTCRAAKLLDRLWA